MTQHADFSRSPAPSRAARRTGALGAVLLAGALLVGSALPAAWATGPTAARATAAAAAQPLATTSSAAAGALDVAVTDISHPVSHPGDKVTIRARVTNTSDATVRQRFAAAADEDRRALVSMLSSAGVPHVALSTHGDWLRPLAMFLKRSAQAK